MYQVTLIYMMYCFFLTALDCGNLTDPVNGQVDHTDGTTNGQTATYSCNTGYNLVGDSTRTCQAEGKWSGSAATCQGTFVINLTLSHPVMLCDFMTTDYHSHFPHCR